MSFASAAVATNGTPVTGNPLRAVWKVECDGDHYKWAQICERKQSQEWILEPY